MKFELGDNVVCIREYETIKVAKHFVIKGCGNLTWIHGTDKKGYGFSVEDDSPCYDNYKLPYNSPKRKKSIFYYFTQDEMDKYFITEEQDYKIYIRNEKLRQILE